MIAAVLVLAAAALSASEDSRLAKGQVVLDVTHDDDSGTAHVDAWVDIPASPNAVWAAMTDCPGAPSFVPDLKSCTIIDRDPKGTWEIREHIVDPGWLAPNIRSRFRAELTPGREMRFAQVDGDFEVMAGTWTLIPHGDGGTRLHYEARIKPRMWVPDFVVHHVIATDAPNSLRALRDEAVRRTHQN